MDASRELTLDPVTRFTGVAPDDEAKVAVAARLASHRPHQRSAQPRNGLMIERIVPGLAAHAVGAEQMGRHQTEVLRVPMAGTLSTFSTLCTSTLRPFCTVSTSRTSGFSESPPTQQTGRSQPPRSARRGPLELANCIGPTRARQGQ